MIIPLPFTLQFGDWGALVAEQLAQYGVKAPLVDESSWREWARTLDNAPELTARNVPDPSVFNDWRAWGTLLSEVLL